MNDGIVPAAVLLVVGLLAILLSFDREVTGALACIGASCALLGVHLGIAGIEREPSQRDRS